MPEMIHVLLTGGVGSRLWPLSRKSRPKQYIPLFSNSSLFELAVKRNLPFSQRLIIVGNQENRHLSIESLKKLKISHYEEIIEATPRNTAPAIAFAAFTAKPDDILLVTPADHIIKDGQNYNDAIYQAIKLAKENFLVTFGISPDKPETGYGYIETNQDEVVSFREKPNKEAATAYIKNGNFLWNSGMFCFKAGVYLSQLEKYCSEIYETSLNAWKEKESGHLNLTSSLEIASISIDYAVMEKSNRLTGVKGSFEWSDMGSFEAIYDYLKSEGHPVDEYGNMYLGAEKYTAFVGLQNSILIETDDANIVIAKEAAQDVKKIYAQLETNHPELI